MSGEAEDFDLLAAIYVLGVLDAEEARAVEELAARDPEVARSVDAWRDRLAPLAALVPPATPPADLWSRIEASLGPAETGAQTESGAQTQTGAQAGTGAAAGAPLPAALPTAGLKPLRRAWRSVTLWRTATAGFALAAGYAAFLLLSQPEPTLDATALSPMGSPAPVFLAQIDTDGSLQVRPLGPVQVAAGRDLELWALPEGAKAPISLGVLPAIGRRLPARQAFRGPVQLLVSLEPAGGSPSGQPTGPVLYGGTLKRL